MHCSQKADGVTHLLSFFTQLGIGDWDDDNLLGSNPWGHHDTLQPRTKKTVIDKKVDCFCMKTKPASQPAKRRYK